MSIVAKDAKFSDGHAKIGVAAGDHATILWPLLCGMARAKYYLLLSEPFTGRRRPRSVSYRWRSTTRNSTPGRSRSPSGWAEVAPAALRWTKQTLNHWLRQAAPIFDASLALEFIGFAGPEGKEGIDAFLQKRTPSYSPDTPI